MSAKDKAKELYLKMLNWETDSNKFLERNIISTSAKQCALIAVDEILKQCWDYRDIDLQASYDYWQEVKHEIQIL